MGKNPADQFYWGDWLNDVELQAASASSRGIWINALCRMWYAKSRGEISGNLPSLVKICNCTTPEFEIFWQEAKTLGFCEVSQNSNGILTLQNRRMFKAEKKRKANRLRQQKHYEKKTSKVHSIKTSRPLSSSSPSSSTSKNKDKDKNVYGEFVKMTTNEHVKLLSKYGSSTTERMIEILDNYKGSTGKKYKSDYRAILSWVADKVVSDRGGVPASAQPRASPKQPCAVCHQLNEKEYLDTHDTLGDICRTCWQEHG